MATVNVKRPGGSKLNELEIEKECVVMHLGCYKEVDKIISFPCVLFEDLPIFQLW
jgi:hypothetical protein